jgi:type IV fimbrial biogenesis protein FimT
MRVGPGRNMRGFTLIELVVTMVVLAILVMAAQPSLRDFFDRYRLRGAGDALVSLIGSARAEAVKTDLDVNVSFTGSGATWCAGANAATPPTGGAQAGAAEDCDCTDTDECRVAGQRSVVDSSAFNGVSIGTLPTDFVLDSKLGTIVPLGTSQARLTSPSGTYTMDVRVTALGQARLCTPSGPSMAGVPSC